jgi:biopolymer transport protein ExbD
VNIINFVDFIFGTTLHLLRSSTKQKDSPLNLQLSFDNTTNQGVFEERKTAAVSVQTNYNNKWAQHDSRMDRQKLRQAVTKYQPAGKINTEVH